MPIMGRFGHLRLVLVGLASASCTGADVPAPASADAPQPVSTAPPARHEPAASVPTPPPAVPAPTAMPTPTAPDPAPADVPIVVSITPLRSAAATSPTWTEIHTFDTRATMQPLDAGVLISAEAEWVVDASGSLVAEPALREGWPPSESVTVGTWPTDAWRVAVTDVERSSANRAFYRWRTDHWLAQRFTTPSGEKVRVLSDMDHEYMYRKSPRSGFLLARTTSPSSIVRVGGRHPAPADAAIPSPSGVHVVDFYETRAGRIVVAAEAAIHVGCADPHGDCEGSSVYAWSADASVPHDGDGRSWAAIGRHGFARALYGEGQNLVFVHDGTQARIEQLPDGRETDRVLGTAAGVLWVALTGTGSDRLLRRDRNGVWTTVALPESMADAPTLAIAVHDADRLWVLAGTAEHSTVFAADLAVPVTEQAG